MRDSYIRVLVHLIWGTWNRNPLITSEVEMRVQHSFQATCQDLKATVIAVGSVEDHVHLLVSFPATISLADFVKQLKGSSSHLVNHEMPNNDLFKWQGAYAAFSVSPQDVDLVAAYIIHQKEHHALNTLRREWELDTLPVS